MTTVAAIAHHGAVHMAGDSMTNVYERPVPNGAIKVGELALADGTVALLGLAGCSGMAATFIRIANGHDGLPQPQGDELDAWAQDVASYITRLAIEHGSVDAGHMDGTCLLGYHGKVWTLTHHLAIPHADGIAAIGSGEGPAIGAIDALLAVGVPARDVILRAVEIAAIRDKHTGGKIRVLSIPARRST